MDMKTLITNMQTLINDMAVLIGNDIVETAIDYCNENYTFSNIMDVENQEKVYKKYTKVEMSALKDMVNEVVEAHPAVADLEIIDDELDMVFYTNYVDYEEDDETVENEYEVLLKVTGEYYTKVTAYSVQDAEYDVDHQYDEDGILLDIHMDREYKVKKVG